MQKIMDAFSDASMKFGLKLNIKKTEVLYFVLEYTYLSADCARDSGTATMCPRGLKARHTVQSCCPPSSTEPNGQGCHLWKIF
jgi:hypothetical protein